MLTTEIRTNKDKNKKFKLISSKKNLSCNKTKIKGRTIPKKKVDIL